jgi:hypothetical protein
MQNMQCTILKKKELLLYKKVLNIHKQLEQTNLLYQNQDDLRVEKDFGS